MHDRKHLCHFGKARGRIELSMIVTYFQCLTLRVRSGHLSNALTRERSWLTEKLVSPPYQSQSVVDSFTYYTNTLQWPNFGPTVQPLGDPWAKWSQRTGLDNFFFLFYFIILYFFFRTQVARNKTSGYTVTKYPPVTPLWANSTTVRRPLDKMKPKDWFRHFFSFLFYFIIFFFLRTQIARNKTSGYMGYKIPSSDPTSGQQYNRQATLGQNEAKGLVKTIFSCFILCSDSSCNFEQDIWLSWL